MYRIVGADQKEYGPVSADQVRQWIAEGRANGQTLVRFEDGPWKPLSTYPEFAATLPPTPPPLSGSAGTPPIPGSYTPAPRNNGFATAGLIFGVLGLLQCCTPFFAVLGLILSSIGLYQISQNPVGQTGRSLAIAGIVCAILGLVLFAGLLFSGILHELSRHLPNFPKP